MPGQTQTVKLTSTTVSVACVLFRTRRINQGRTGWHVDVEGGYMKTALMTASLTVMAMSGFA